MAKKRKRRGSSRGRRKDRTRVWKLISLVSGLFLLILLFVWSPLKLSDLVDGVGSWRAWTAQPAESKPEAAEQPELPARPDPPAESSTARIFFSNSNRDPQSLDCSLVFPVSRPLSPGSSVARAALEELLKGPTPGEESEGYYTSINPGVRIEKFRIENGAAWVDFDDRFDLGVAGSCQVEAIRSQIEQTLLQFPSIREVQITVQGRLSTAFQP